MDVLNPSTPSGIASSSTSTPPLLTRDAALFLDFDGTLVELAATPDQIRPSTQLALILADLRSRLGEALAIITGRRLESLDIWLGELCLPGAGLHGAQLRPPGSRQASQTAVPELSAVAAQLRQDFGKDPRILIEDKGAALALHYRLAPERALECQTRLRELCAPHALEVLIGHAVVEARRRGVDKGSGLHALMALAPFAGRRPVFIGDDRSDEDAIAAAQTLGGDGVRVGQQPSVARYRLRDVSAVHDWLEASRAALIQAAR